MGDDKLSLLPGREEAEKGSCMQQCVLPGKIQDMELPHLCLYVCVIQYFLSLPTSSFA